MEADVLNALQNDLVIDITTTGRRTGEPRRIEIWLRALGDRYVIAGRPGPRNWLANLRANPKFTVHLKKSVTADLAATARPVDDPAERRSLLQSIPNGPGDDVLDEWVANSPMVEVTFD